MDLKQEQFFAGDVVQASGLDNASLQNVLKRGRIDLPNPGTGGRRLFSAETILHLAYTRHLMDRGLGPNQATFLVARGSTRYPDETLREYLTAPTGKEVFVFNPTLKPDDEIGGVGYEFVADGVVDFGAYSNAISLIVLRVGEIAKDVLAKLEVILQGRKSL